METLFGNLEDIAIERLQEFEKVALSKHPDGYYLAYSGGKDSDVILDIAKRAGVKFTAHYHLTTCDPPELVYHVRTHPEVEIHKPKETIWAMIRRKGMPPRRNARYCCDLLKEHNGGNRMIVTGVRWEESARRSKRRMTEACMKNKGSHYLHPIIDWNKEDVWGYIKSSNVPYCKLYDEGFKRLGCVLCPMATKKQTLIELKRWPKIAKAWEKAVKATFNPSLDKRVKFKNEQKYWEWWLDRDRKSMKSNENQMMFFED
ncbi:MAG: phosphoadenosine phosphosulfate reductase [Planctomycetota bacterium]|nr:MAG: phosphoadenosine phosphosulfate reductase [Planctomycetota bacterium]